MKASAQFTVGHVQCTVMPDENNPRSFSFAPEKENEGSYEFVLENFSGRVILKDLAAKCVVFSHDVVDLTFSPLPKAAHQSSNKKPPTSAIKGSGTPMSINTPPPHAKQGWS
jgi:hypothetical protein